MKKVLVAGATGHLGKAVIRELHGRGYWVRALARSPGKLQDLGDIVNDVVAGDIADAPAVKRACAGIDAVFSCLGASLDFGLSRERGSYRDVDYTGNKRLLEAAMRAGVGKFVYVSVYGAAQLRHHEYVRAHEDFVDELKRSGIAYAVVRPTGFFHTQAEVVRLARYPVMTLLGAGDKRTNPIHEQDLAVICVDAIEGERTEYEVGGTETYTRKEINELAFAAHGKKPRMIRVPASFVNLGLRALQPMDRRLYEMLRFLVAVTQKDCVAPPTGTHSLEQYYREVAGSYRQQQH
ncbi:MAG: SDR family oxidoreductase [Pyrinomonadaceae bacterium]